MFKGDLVPNTSDTSTNPIQNGIGTFSSSGKFNAEGNIMSLIYGDDFVDTSVIPYTHEFNSLFLECSTLINSRNCKLPATTLKNYSYYKTFYKCINLKSAPEELPADVVNSSSYAYMFSHCESLIKTPKIYSSSVGVSGCLNMFNANYKLRIAEPLPATTVRDFGYYSMFYNCSTLETIFPILPATKLGKSSYHSMFNRCINLKTAPELPATTMDISTYYYMFAHSGIINAPELPATKLANFCYEGMFYNCKDLVNPPTTMPMSTTLVYPRSYMNMFTNCTSLTHVPTMDISTSATSIASNNIHNCANMF